MTPAQIPSSVVEMSINQGGIIPFNANVAVTANIMMLLTMHVEADLLVILENSR